MEEVAEMECGCGRGRCSVAAAHMHCEACVTAPAVTSGKMQIMRNGKVKDETCIA